MGRPFKRRTRKGRKDSPEILTYKDLRKHLVKNPSRMYRHLKYDPDLAKENKTDLLRQLQEKHLRARRLQEHAVSMRPGLERCMSWSAPRSNKSEMDEANARLRHYKALSLDVSGLGQGNGNKPGRLLGGTNESSELGEIPEHLNTQIPSEEDKMNLEANSERKRSLFHRSDAVTRSGSSDDIPLDPLKK